MLNEILKLVLAIFIPAWFFLYLYRRPTQDGLATAIDRLEKRIAKEREVRFSVRWRTCDDAAFVFGLESALALLKKIPSDIETKLLIPTSCSKSVGRCIRCGGWGYVPILGTRYKEDPCQSCNGKKVLSAAEET